MRRAVCALAALIILALCAAPAWADPAPAGSGVAYEIFTGAFSDSDGDGTGDLQGIRSRLDYIQALGADMIWLTPIHPSPSYHHYDVTDYLAVAPEFGTVEGFEALAADCHDRGIRLIVDLVVNHTGVDHPWFKEAAAALASGLESPYIDYYNFSQDSAAGHPVPGADGWYYEGRFGPHMPDLNLDSAAVRSEIASIIAFWQARGADGFRLDATTSYYTGAAQKNAAFIAWVTETARQTDPDCYIVGECWADGPTILSLYEGGADSLFNFPLSDAGGVLVQAALSGQGAAVARVMASWHEALCAVSPDIVDAPFLTNHDQARARGMLRSDMDAMKAAAMLYLLLPGRPFVYYGEELGLSGSGRDENKRQPMLWGGDAADTCAPFPETDQKQRLKGGVSEQDADPDSLLNWYRQLIALRAAAPELNGGPGMTALETGCDGVCAFVRGDVAVLINVSRTETAAPDLSALNGFTEIGRVGGSGEWGILPPMSCCVMRRSPD